jgi:hypothetical protein
MKRAVAVTLKIPDNTAYTTAVALRNLGLPVDRVERSEVWFFNDAGDPAALLARIESDATIFNPNKHRATVLDQPHPREGEVWIEQFDARQGPTAIAWRLFVAGGRRAGRRLLTAAAEGLLCNSAIECASFGGDDKGNVSE